ncbi:MAG: sugar phosphate isomerase/epimerase [Gammaproteobacteria bacterium]|nr:sugar phosphate isomerase/epimerase [Gammaproteobacteria bacterium]
MQLRTYKTLWGHQGNYKSAAQQAIDAGFNGIEGPVPVEPESIAALMDALTFYHLDYIAEVCTAGSYVPDRNASMADHLESLAQRLPIAKQLGARFVSCIAGCDAWPIKQSVAFFERTMDMAERQRITISFETHRSRTLFNPWITLDILERLPELKLTCDFSHWCVVCERLPDTEPELLARVYRHAHHIHARVGYDQGPQVPHPAAPEYAAALNAHQKWWAQIWQSQLARGYEIFTLTPEFGPDGYLHTLPFTQAPVADLWQINCWMAETERAHFAHLFNTVI